MTKLNIKFIVTVAAAVFATIVIGLGALAIHKINDLNNEINNLNSRLTQIGQNSNNTQWEINNLKNEIKQQLAEQGRNYYDADYKIIAINTASNTATIEVYFSLKETSLSGDVEISFGSGNQFDSIAATKLTGGKYMAELDLIMDKDYEISYSVILSSVKTEKLLDINLLSRLTNRFSVEKSFHYINREDLKLVFYLSNNYQKDNNLKIVTAKLEIFKDGALFKSYNMKDYDYGANNGYESCGKKDLTVDGLTQQVLDTSNIQVIITVVDNYGLTYTF